MDEAVKIFGLGGVSLATIISITQLVKLLRNGKSKESSSESGSQMVTILNRQTELLAQQTSILGDIKSISLSNGHKLEGLSKHLVVAMERQQNASEMIKDVQKVVNGR